MALEIASALVARLLGEAAASPDAEVCGLLFGTSARIEAVETCANVADDPARMFEIDPVALFAALQAQRTGGPKLIGYWHSHPDGLAQPSQRDAASAAPDGSIWLIVGEAGYACFRAVAHGQIHGRFDPLAVRICG